MQYEEDSVIIGNAEDSSEEKAAKKQVVSEKVNDVGELKDTLRIIYNEKPELVKSEKDD